MILMGFSGGALGIYANVHTSETPFGWTVAGTVLVLLPAYVAGWLAGVEEE